MEWNGMECIDGESPTVTRGIYTEGYDYFNGKSGADH